MADLALSVFCFYSYLCYLNIISHVIIIFLTKSFYYLQYYINIKLLMLFSTQNIPPIYVSNIKKNLIRSTETIIFKCIFQLHFFV